MSTYDLYQQVFCVSLKVCGSAEGKGTPAYLAGLSANKLKQLFAQLAVTDEWEIAWGPAVWQHKSGGAADQTMAVCHNKTKNLYQIAIAATNPKSIFDIKEDLAVRPKNMKPLPGDPNAKISNGDFIALGNLTTMTPTTGFPASGQTLAQFLKMLPPANAQLVVSGHSLGGGLAPLLAYSLLKQGLLGTGWSQMNVYPTAAPTVSDQAFATAFAAAFKPTAAGTADYRQWNAVLYNGNDIVPHAWSTTQSPELQDVTASGKKGAAMFWADAPMALEVHALRVRAIGMVGSESPYITIASSKLFTGEQQKKIWDQVGLDRTALYQHIAAYIDFFGVNALVSPAEAEAMIQPGLLQLLSDGAGEGTIAQEATAAAEGDRVE
ncbi:lipase family protein [Sphingomonas sp. CJ20]